MNTHLLSGLVVSLMVGTFLFFGTAAVFAQNITPPLPGEIQTEGQEGGWTLVPEECLGDSAATECGFEQMLQLVANIIGLSFVIALGLATLLFGYAGFRYATSAGNTGQVEGAKKIFKAVATGLIIIFLAYTIVQVIVSILGVEENYNQFLEDQAPS